MICCQRTRLGMLPAGVVQFARLHLCCTDCKVRNATCASLVPCMLIGFRTIKIWTQGKNGITHIGTQRRREIILLAGCRFLGGYVMLLLFGGCVFSSKIGDFVISKCAFNVIIFFDFFNTSLELIIYLFIYICVKLLS